MDPVAFKTGRHPSGIAPVGSAFEVIVDDETETAIKYPFLPRISEKRCIFSKFSGGIFLKEIIIQRRFIALKNSAEEVIPVFSGARIIRSDGIELLLCFAPEFFPQLLRFQSLQFLSGGRKLISGNDKGEKQSCQDDFFERENEIQQIIHNYSS